MGVSVVSADTLELNDQTSQGIGSFDHRNVKSVMRL